MVKNFTFENMWKEKADQNTFQRHTEKTPSFANIFNEHFLIKAIKKYTFVLLQQKSLKILLKTFSKEVNLKSS